MKKWVIKVKRSSSPLTGWIQAVKKAQRAFLTRGFHDGRSAAPVMRGVISDVHAAGNDRFDFAFRLFEAGFCADKAYRISIDYIQIKKYNV